MELSLWCFWYWAAFFTIIGISYEFLFRIKERFE